MKTIFYKFMLTVIVCVGLLVGMVKGQEARQKWVTKKKAKYENKKNQLVDAPDVNSLVILDEFEMATYHQ
jgi:hypothetical protein